MKNYLYTAAEQQTIEEQFNKELGASNLFLIRRAAEAITQEALIRWPKLTKATFYCGSGKNSADGLVTAGLLANRGVRIKIVMVEWPPRFSAELAKALRFCKQTSAEFVTEHDTAEEDLIVDAIFGTGLNRKVTGTHLTVIKKINKSEKPVLAIDIPSGLTANDGAVLGDAIRANLTVSLVVRKKGLYTGKGSSLSGKVILRDLNIPPKFFHPTNTHLLQLDECLSQIPERNKDAHKTAFGHVLVVGGEYGMGGAVIMAAEAAFRSGAGLVSVATRDRHALAILLRQPEIMAQGVSCDAELDPLIQRATHVVLGPGLGKSEWSRWLFAKVLSSGKQGVIDADALNILSESPKDCHDWVLTPHYGEATRLLDGDQDINRFSTLAKIQKKFGGVVVLKGAGSLITDGETTTVCPYGNPGMAVAGMGDVLSGFVGGLLAQGMSLFKAAQTAVVLHAYAGDQAALKAGTRGLMATDLIPVVRKLIG